MLKKSILLALMTGLVGAFAVAFSGPASAVGTCAIRAQLPARVPIDRFNVVVPVASSNSNCTGLDWYASADLYGPSGTIAYLYFSNTSTQDSATFYATNDAPGTYKTIVESSLAYAGTNLVPVSWTSTATTFKYATYSYVATSRAGRAVYVNGLIKNYSNSYAGLVYGAHRTVYLQRYLNGAWQTILARTASSTGRIAVGFIQSRVYQYRLVTSESSTAWSGTSVTSFR